MEMIKTSALKLPKITERQADLYSAQQATCIEIKETLLLTPEIRTAVFEYSKGVGTNGTLVHEMSHSSDRTGRSTGERLPITDVKE
jgi:hypothetical protein